MEDIMEELVGEIYDESDEVDHSFTDLGNNCYEVSAFMSLSDMADRMNIPEDIIESDSNTAGGWAMKLFGRIPTVGETITNGIFTIKILAADESHVERISIKVDRPEEKEEQ